MGVENFFGWIKCIWYRCKVFYVKKILYNFLYNIDSHLAFKSGYRSIKFLDYFISAIKTCVIHSPMFHWFSFSFLFFFLIKSQTARERIFSAGAANSVLFSSGIFFPVPGLRFSLFSLPQDIYNLIFCVLTQNSTFSHYSNSVALKFPLGQLAVRHCILGASLSFMVQ